MAGAAACWTSGARPAISPRSWRAADFRSRPSIATASRRRREPSSSTPIWTTVCRRSRNRFDYIICADVLEHLRDPLRMLRDCHARLAPGGALILSLPNSGHWYFRWNVLLGRFPQHDRGLFDRTHLHFYTWDGWVELLHRAGFEIEPLDSAAVPVGLALPRWDGSLAVRAMERLSYRCGAHVEAPVRVSVHRPRARRAEPMSSRPAKVVVVMPAYNAARTLHMTYAALPHDVVDLVILVDDGSKDETARLARELGLELFVHDRNYGYGANQKTCYREALRAGASIVVMVHPDYQYDPTLLPEIIRPIQRRQGRRGSGLAAARRAAPDAAGHAVVEILFQPLPDRARESRVRPESLRISHRVSRVPPRGPGGVEPADELRQVHLRPGDHRADRQPGFPHRRSAGPDALLRPGLVGVLRRQHALRLFHPLAAAALPPASRGDRPRSACSTAWSGAIAAPPKSGRLGTASENRRASGPAGGRSCSISS